MVKVNEVNFGFLFYTFIESKQKSPWKNQETKGVTVLTRNEILQKDGAKEWVFDHWKYLVHNQIEINERFYE